MELQRSLQQPHDGEPFPVRIGLPAGEALRKADDFFGHAGILAARVAATNRKPYRCTLRLERTTGFEPATLTLTIATSSCRPVPSRPSAQVTPLRESRHHMPADPIAIG